MYGKVYLVGAGPGDPKLITVKGLELIRKADCIVYDRLIAPELLAYAGENCEKIYVGKADSRHTLPQEEINSLLVEKAKEYKNVIRLKGGDVYVFGRGGEEALYLREHGVAFEVVPGVSSATAGAAYAGIPVTHRGLADGFRVVTAHHREGAQEQIAFSTMTNEKETLVFLMGLSRVKEIAEGLLSVGRRKETPVAVISHATTPMQRTVTGNLTDIAERVSTANLTSPAMIVVGDTVTLQDGLDFMKQRPLWGRHYLVPKIGAEPSKLAELLRKNGAYVQERQVGSITGIPAVYTKKELEGVDVLLFTSANAVKWFMKNLSASGLDARALGSVRLAVIGTATANKLQEYGLCADFMPEHYNSDILVKELKQYMDEELRKEPFHKPVVWYPTAKNAKDDTVDALVQICECGRLNVYENREYTDEMQEKPKLCDFDGIFFTCASSAKRLLSGYAPEELANLGQDTAVYSIGPKCSVAITGLGIANVTEAAVSTCEGLANLVCKR